MADEPTQAKPVQDKLALDPGELMAIRQQVGNVNDPVLMGAEAQLEKVRRVVLPLLGKLVDDVNKLSEEDNQSNECHTE